jgi:two-component system cell cycle response regulator
VLLLDVDRFKPLNDRHGHAAGDQALRAVADALREHLRAVDIVARYGGEEFLVVMAGAGEEEAAAVAERLRQAIAQARVPVGAETLAVTVSVGTAVTRGTTDADRLVAAADAAMYRAKQNGRNRVEAAQAADWAEEAG